MICTVSAGPAAASVRPLLAVGPGEPGRTSAAVATGVGLHAASSVKARSVRAPHAAGLAVLPVEALRTGAAVAVQQILQGRRERRNLSGWQKRGKLPTDRKPSNMEGGTAVL